MVILKSPKNVFWEALLVAVVLFMLGFLIGMFIETNRVTQVNDFYANSEISMMDGLALNFLTEMQKENCDNLVNATLIFADNIYNEAKVLEKYEQAGKIDQSIKIVHKRYDLLRTFLWMNSLQIKEKCPQTNFSIVVYLYTYQEKDLVKKAEQSVWEKVLGEVKESQGNKIILIPMAVDLNVGSLTLLASDYNVTQYPSVILPSGEVLQKPISSKEVIAKL